MTITEVQRIRKFLNILCIISSYIADTLRSLAAKRVIALTGESSRVVHVQGSLRAGVGSSSQYRASPRAGRFSFDLVTRAHRSQSYRRRSGVKMIAM